MKKSGFVLTLAAALLLALGGFGCSQINSVFDSEPTPEPQAEAAYHEFDDIQIPAELTFDEKRSFYFEAPDFKAGTLYFKGYVEVESLTSFFIESMAQDGWKLRSIFRSPKMMLLFEKGKKVSVIIIYEETVYTHVEVWVAPAL